MAYGITLLLYGRTPLASDRSRHPGAQHQSRICGADDATGLAYGDIALHQFDFGIVDPQFYNRK